MPRHIATRLVRLVVVCLMVLVAQPTVSAHAATSASQRDSQIKSLREQIQHASAEEAEFLDRVDEAASARKTLDAEVAAIDAEVTGQQSSLESAQTAHETSLAELDHARRALEGARARLKAGRKMLTERAVAAYIGNPTATAANALLEVESVRDLESTRVYFEVVVQAQQRQVSKLRHLRVEAHEAESDVAGRVDEAKAKFDVVKSSVVKLETARASAGEVRDRARGFEVSERALFTEAKDRTEELEARLSSLQAESDSIGNILRLRGAGSGERPGKLEPPIPFAVITSGFGSRTHPVLGTVRNHNGIDLRASTGTPVRAAADGEVILAGPRGGYGNTIVVGHGGELATLSAHLSQVLVRSGQAVTAGQVIGLAGSTGMSTGPHLHFEVRRNGTPVNPLSYL